MRLRGTECGSLWCCFWTLGAGFRGRLGLRLLDLKSVSHCEGTQGLERKTYHCFLCPHIRFGSTYRLLWREVWSLDAGVVSKVLDRRGDERSKIVVVQVGDNEDRL